MASKRNLRRLTDRATRLETERLRAVATELQTKFRIVADLGSARTTLNLVLVPTDAPAAPPDLADVDAALRRWDARAVPVASEDRLYVGVARRNAPSDRAVGVGWMILGALLVGASLLLTPTALHRMRSAARDARWPDAAAPRSPAS